LASNKTIYENSPININCAASGIPSVTVRWKKGGNELVYRNGKLHDRIKTREYNYNNDYYTRELHIEEATLEDGGQYTCMYV
jgi:hypothetical protein